MEKKFTTNIPELFYEQDIQLIKQYGWMAHYVPDEELPMNIHTHGLKENFNHTDIQIVMRFRPEVAQTLLHLIVREIEAGKKYETGQLYDDLFNMPFEFKKAMECDRLVLRMIIPDPNGFFPNDPNVEEEYKKQYMNILE